MYALRERRVHVTQEDFEMAVAKVCLTDLNMKLIFNNGCFSPYLNIKPVLLLLPGHAERQREEHVDQEAVEVKKALCISCTQCKHMYIFLLFVYGL